MATWEDLIAFFDPRPAFVVAEGPPLRADGDALVLPCAQPVLGLEWSADGRWLAAASGGRILGADGTVRVAEPGTGRCLLLHGHGRGTHTVAFDPRGLLASAGHDGVVGLWDLDGRRGLAIRGPVPRQTVAFARGGDWLLVGDELAARGTASRLVILDLSRPGTVRTEVLPVDHLVAHVAVRPDDGAVLVHLYHRDGAQRFECRSLPGWELAWSADLPPGHHVHGLCWAMPDVLVRSVTDLGRVRRLERIDPATGGVLLQRVVEDTLVGGVAVDVLRGRIATIGAGGTLRLWALSDFAPLGEGVLGRWPAASVALSPDGRQVAVGSALEAGVLVLSLP